MKASHWGVALLSPGAEEQNALRETEQLALLRARQQVASLSDEAKCPPRQLTTQTTRPAPICRWRGDADDE